MNESSATEPSNAAPSSDAPSSDAPAPGDRPSGREAVLGGLLAGSAAAFVLLFGSTWSGMVGLLEVVHNGFTRFVPLALFELAVSTLGPLAKGLLFVGIVAALILLGGAIGWLAVRLGAVGRRSSFADGLFVGALAWLFAEVVVLPVFGAGFFGSDLALGPLPLHVPLAAATLAYGLVLVGIVRGVRPAAVPAMAPAAPSSAAGGSRLGRRSFLGRSLVLLGLGAFAGSAVQVASRLVHAVTTGTSRSGRPQAPGGFGPTAQVTPLDEFYVIGKDLSPTVVDGVGWRLVVSGLVDRPSSYSLDEIRALPAVEDYRTLQCISNEVTSFGRLIGMQRWKGTRVRDVLEASGLRAEATHVLWRSADGFTESLPLPVALDERTWLVYEMGPPGTALTADHGFPLRVLIAGRYGMKQPKYLTEIIVADHDEPGYWVQRSWDQTAAVRTYSRIDEPLHGDNVPSERPFNAYGIASAGDRGIARVEISADGGATWREAELEPPLGELAWVRWRIEVVPPGPGRLDLVARATDGQGNVQDATVRPVLPSGATGLHRVAVAAVPGLPSQPAGG